MIYRISFIATFCLSTVFSAMAFADHARLGDGSTGMKLYDCTISLADSDTRKVLGKPTVHVFDFSAKEAVRQAMATNEYVTPGILDQYGLIAFAKVKRTFDKFKVGESVVVYDGECGLNPQEKPTGDEHQ